MKPSRSSETALATALMRAVHTRCDVPRLIDDPYGDRLVSDAERARFLERIRLTLSERRRQAIAGIRDPARALDLALRAAPAYGEVVVRLRYAEDALARAIERGVSQYVLVGAGMDTFALRHPELRGRLRIIEIDHPATQAQKRERFARAGLAPPPNLHFVAADLERESLDQALARSPFAAGDLAFFAWLGVTPYLSRSANLATLRSMAACSAPSSEVAFDYLEASAYGAQGSPALRIIEERAGTPEPLVSGFDPETLARDLASVGFALVEDLAPEEANARYCAGRRDGLRVPSHGHLALARVASLPAAAGGNG